MRINKTLAGFIRSLCHYDRNEAVSSASFFISPRCSEQLPAAAAAAAVVAAAVVVVVVVMVVKAAVRMVVVVVVAVATAMESWSWWEGMQWQSRGGSGGGDSSCNGVDIELEAFVAASVGGRGS